MTSFKVISQLVLSGKTIVATECASYDMAGEFLGILAVFGCVVALDVGSAFCAVSAVSLLAGEYSLPRLVFGFVIEMASFVLDDIMNVLVIIISVVVRVSFFPVGFPVTAHNAARDSRERPNGMIAVSPSFLRRPIQAEKTEATLARCHTTNLVDILDVDILSLRLG